MEKLSTQYNVSVMMSLFAQLLIIPVVLILPVGLIGCASKSIQSGAAAPSQVLGMDARIQIQDKTEKKTVTITAEAVMADQSRTRLDLMGPFGAVLGRLVLQQDRVALLVPQQKKVYFGIASDKSFRPVLPMSVHPQVLSLLLRGQTPGEWSCEKPVNGKETCLWQERNIRFERLIQEGKPVAANEWSLESDTYKVTCIPNSVTTKVQLKQDTFSVPIPVGYTKHKLP